MTNQGHSTFISQMQFTKVENALTKLGLKLTEDNHEFFLKWVECKKNINYEIFREGYQIVNHISNASCLTTKVGLLQTLRDYERHQKTLRKKFFSVNDFFMETYKVDSSHECQIFFKTFTKGELWICKPSCKNQGKGIFLVDDLSAFKKKINKENLSPMLTKPCWIIQRYLMNPLLIHACKFDVRVYMLIASVQPCLAYYHKGYARVACVPYSNETLDLTAHLTNQYVQKKHPLYKDKKEQTVLSFDQFNKYINQNVKESKLLPEDWVLNDFQDTMKVIMVTCLEASLNRLDKRRGCFDLLGFDFIIDENMKVWLIEINTNPALHTNCSVLNDLLPPMVEETLNIVLELFDKNTFDKLTSPLNFQPIFNSATGYQFQIA